MVELRDLDEARRYVTRGLWLQRAVRPSTATIRPALEWAMEIAAGGHPLPPIGFVADIGNIAFGADTEHRNPEAREIPGWPPSLGRMYEDHVIGRLYADAALERAADTLQKFHGRDRTKGLAFLVNQMCERMRIGGVFLPPAVIRSLLTANPDEVLAAAWDDLLREGVGERLVGLYRGIVAAARQTGEVLSREDVAALEDRSALGDMGQYVALRQIRQITNRFLSGLPVRPVKPRSGRKEVPTRVRDEDQYPIGGYSSIATKGSIESLLHSQLAYIEDASGEPDLFDVKYARDELFYYSRDENQFLRRRRVFAFVLFPNLVSARFKDADLPAQRIVLLQSAILAVITRLTEWLSTDAIRFEVLFVQEADRKPLAEEATLAELLLREQSERGHATVAHVPDRAAVIARLEGLARQAQVHCLATAAAPVEIDLESGVVTELVVAGPRPLIGSGEGVVAELEGEDAFEVWQEAVLRILQLWV